MVSHLSIVITTKGAMMVIKRERNCKVIRNARNFDAYGGENGIMLTSFVKQRIAVIVAYL